MKPKLIEARDKYLLEISQERKVELEYSLETGRGYKFEELSLLIDDSKIDPFIRKYTFGKEILHGINYYRDHTRAGGFTSGKYFIKTEIGATRDFNNKIKVEILHQATRLRKLEGLNWD